MRVVYAVRRLSSQHRAGGGNAPRIVVLTPARILTFVCLAIVLLGSLSTSLGFLLMLGAKLVPFLLGSGVLLMKDGLILFLVYRAARLGWLILKGSGRQIARSTWYIRLRVQIKVELRVYAARVRRLIIMCAFLIVSLLWLLGFQ